MHDAVGYLIFLSISHLSIILLLDFPFQSRLERQLDVITLWMCWVRKWFLCLSLRAGLPPQPRQQALRLAGTLLLELLQCEWKCLIQSHVRVEQVWKFWRLAVLRSGCSLGWEQCHAPCGVSQPLSTSIQAQWLLLVSLYISSSPSLSKMLWTNGIPSLRVLCVHTHFKQLSLDPELSPDPKANMTFDNLPLRSPHYFRTMMYLEVSACPCVCSYSDTLLSARSWVSLLLFLSFWRGDVDTVCSSETGGN